MSITEEKLYKVLKDARNTCDQYVNIINRSSFGMCRLYSVVLKEYLDTIYPDIKWNFSGGWQKSISMSSKEMSDYIDLTNPDGGMLSSYSEEYESHYWIQGNELNLDIYADQFGYDEIMITDIKDNIYNCNLNSELINDEIYYDVSCFHFDVTLKNIEDPVQRFKYMIRECLKLKHAKNKTLEYII